VTVKWKARNAATLYLVMPSAVY